MLISTRVGAVAQVAPAPRPGHPVHLRAVTPSGPGALRGAVGGDLGRLLPGASRPVSSTQHKTRGQHG